LTDRTDLDTQLLETFTRTHLKTSCRQAKEIAGGTESLHELLKVPVGGIVFTTIQKFMPATMPRCWWSPRARRAQHTHASTSASQS